MDCARARALTWPPDRPRIADQDVVGARDHIASCAACRAHFEIDHLLSDVRKGLLDARPPREVRERIFQAVAELRSNRKRVRRVRRAYFIRTIAVAGLAILGAVVIARFASPGGAQHEMDAAFVEDYNRLAVREDHIVTSDSAEVRRFLLRELGQVIAPLSAPGFRIVGAEVCLLEGQRGAMIRYETKSGTVSYYLLPEPGSVDRPPSSGPAGDGGAALVSWVSGSVRRALVGALPARELMRLASSSMP